MKNVLIIAALALLLGSCAASKNSAARNLQGNWQLTMFPDGGKTFAEMFGDRRPELNFDVASNKVTGSTGCNRLSTSFNLNKGLFLFDKNIITTKMACPGYEESTYLNALSRVNRYVIEGDQLRLLNDSSLIMTFAKQQ